MRRSTLVVAFLFAAAGCDRGMAPDLDADGSPLGASDAVTLSASAGPTRVPGRFIVTLAARADAREVAREHDLIPDFVYANVLNGFAGSISEAARTGLMRDVRVIRIDPDQVFSSAVDGVQLSAPWGLDRVDQRSVTLDKQYIYPGTARGVTAYIVDGGVYYAHRDLVGRSVRGFDAYGGDGSDCRGHGTHVAATAGGTNYGIAKELSLVSVRVLDCSGSGTTSALVSGLDWIVANARKPAVVNMSLSGPADELLDAVVRRVIGAGIPVVVAAGNSARDACSYSPGRVSEAITVGASNQSDNKPYFSNWGPCIDIYAPGVGIRSATIGTDTATAELSGTSMATPHVSGAAALILAADPLAAPSQVAAMLAAQSTKGIVLWEVPIGNLLYVGGVTSVPAPNSAPVAAFTASCSSLACAFTDQSRDVDGSIAAWRWDFGDGGAATGVPASHTYAADGTYRVTLVVTDDKGMSSSTSSYVSFAQPEVANRLPEPAFTAACARLTCAFVDQSRDIDGQISSWEWSFGDGSAPSSLSAAGTEHAFPSSGFFTVTLAVRDDAGGTATTAKRVPVGVILVVAGTKVKGRATVDVRWSGATTDEVTVAVNGVVLATVPNSGTYSYRSNTRGQASYTFTICETGLAPVCSAPQTAWF